jgi:uncharacterized protein
MPDDWRKRVIEERIQLEDRISRLSQFINGEAYRDLEHEDRRLLSEQEQAMVKYSLILKARISRFSMIEQGAS